MKRLKDETFFRLLRSFLTVYLPQQRMCSANTVKSCREAFNLLFSFLEMRKSIALFDVSFELLDAPVIQEFLTWLETERHCAASTINQRLACIRSFFNYAGKMEFSLLEHQNELRKISLKKSAASQSVEFLSENALKSVLEAPDVKIPKGFRDMFHMILLYDTGARNQELLDLRLKDIDLAPKRGMIRVTGKGNKQRLIPIMEKTVEHCKKYLNIFHRSEPDSNQYLLYTIRQGEKRQMSADNVARFLNHYGGLAKAKCSEVPDKIHPHLFRHTRAMHLYRGGMPLALLSEWLGHAQFETTLIYAHADTEMKRQAIQKATAAANPIRKDVRLPQAWKDDEELLRELYGLK